ncbi:ATP:corrinoid adenosyltransferase [Synechococcus sp. PCC 7502]|uniref:ATP--corrinoid adenosyltransferase n=1 Tax=Synechococcus sp. PCC 7502 TaxID=1173263 RepID=UPI00029F8649|nr:ATP--corrinoid adenosyltransferase [Synechococcus sp. PCC 7502]AFY74983.1 ATP:corrinoid adenosyltransferase [Synechococcus sp. PCC 7502]
MVAQIQTTPDLKPTAKKLSMSASQGLVQIFTAPERTFYVDVFAQALRLGGQGRSVLIAQFFKGGINQGVDSPRKLGQNLTWFRGNLSRSIEADMQLTELESTAILDLWTHVKEHIATGDYELIILDELNLAVERSLVSQSEIIETLTNRPRQVDVILTGANMPISLISIADQVTQRRR